MSILVGDLPDPHVEARPFKKLGARFVDTCAVFIDGMKIPRRNIVGEEGNVLKAMFDVLNPERIIVAAAAVGTGLLAIRKAVEFANERKIWGERPVSSYQGLQFPLAEAKVLLETAKLKVYEAAWLYDQGSPKCAMATTIGEIRRFSCLDLCRGPGDSDDGRKRIYVRVWRRASVARSTPERDCPRNE